VRRRLSSPATWRSFFSFGVALFLFTLTAGCSWFGDTGSSDLLGYRLPLSVELRLDPTVTGAEVSYRDACRRTRIIAVGKELTDRVHREMARAFEHLYMAPAQKKTDGVVEIALGINELALPLVTQRDRTYSATLTLGAAMAYVDAGGQVLYSKNLKTDTQGEVTTADQQCEVDGLPRLVQDAAAKLAEGLKTHLSNSTRLRAAAEAKSSRP
jgi:hypothetical protein